MKSRIERGWWVCQLIPRYLEYVKILPNGAILVGKNIVIDGHAKRPLRIITHVHADHIIDLEDSIRECKEIIATKITLDLLEALQYVNSNLLPIFKVKKRPLDYCERYLYENEEIYLLPVDHIPGAAQVRVELKSEKVSIGYTGDFKLTQKTEIMRDLDVLIIEATYGHPSYRRSYKESVNSLLADLVKEGLKRYKRVYIYAYHGKIQEAMIVLREYGLTEPYIVPSRVYNATKILEEKYQFNIGNYYKDTEVLKLKNAEGIVFFKHFNSAKHRRLDGKALHIVLTGRILAEPFKKLDDYTYAVSLSDHGDFDDLVNYVVYANPKLVVIDGSRRGYAEILREHLVEKGFYTIVLPERKGEEHR
jgi:putative mRNA 3-end processing factor